MIRNLVFDFGNVLLSSDFEHLLRLIADDEKVRNEVREVLFCKQFTAQLDLGLIPSDELFKKVVSENPSLATYIISFKNRWMEHLPCEMPGMPDLLRTFKAKGYRLYGLSNWSDMIYPVMKRFAIFQLLDGAVISCEEHLMKPDASIYRRLFEKYSLRPEECLFIDDKAANVEAGRTLGMEGVVFTSAEQLSKTIF